MKFKKLFKGGLAAMVISALVFQLAACGTIMYPERKGQQSGKIDPGVAVLDGLGLLLFIIPGVIAFAVDFSNGTIYLPGTASTGDSDGKYSEWATLTVPADTMTRDGFEEVIAEHTNIADALSRQGSRTFEVASLDEASQRLATISD